MKYPDRPKDMSKNDFGGTMYPCKCGHYGHNHDVTMLGTFNFFLGGSTMIGKCEECLCGMYKKDTEWNNK